MARGLIKTLGLAGAALTAWYFLDPKKGADRRGNFVKSSKDLYDTASDEIGRLTKDLASGVASGVSGVVDRVGQMTGMSSDGSSSSAQLEAGEKAGKQEAAPTRSEHLSAAVGA